MTMGSAALFSRFVAAVLFVASVMMSASGSTANNNNDIVEVIVSIANVADEIGDDACGDEWDLFCEDGNTLSVRLDRLKSDTSKVKTEGGRQRLEAIIQLIRHPDDASRKATLYKKANAAGITAILKSMNEARSNMLETLRVVIVHGLKDEHQWISAHEHVYDQAWMMLLKDHKIAQALSDAELEMVVHVLERMNAQQLSRILAGFVQDISASLQKIGPVLQKHHVQLTSEIVNVFTNGSLCNNPEDMNALLDIFERHNCCSTDAEKMMEHRNKASILYKFLRKLIRDNLLKDGDVCKVFGMLTTTLQMRNNHGFYTADDDDAHALLQHYYRSLLKNIGCKKPFSTAITRRSSSSKRDADDDDDVFNEDTLLQVLEEPSQLFHVLGDTLWYPDELIMRLADGRMNTKTYKWLQELFGDYNADQSLSPRQRQHLLDVVRTALNATSTDDGGIIANEVVSEFLDDILKPGNEILASRELIEWLWRKDTAAPDDIDDADYVNKHVLPALFSADVLKKENGVEIITEFMNKVRETAGPSHRRQQLIQWPYSWTNLTQLLNIAPRSRIGAQVKMFLRAFWEHQSLETLSDYQNAFEIAAAEPAQDDHELQHSTNNTTTMVSIVQDVVNKLVKPEFDTPESRRCWNDVFSWSISSLERQKNTTSRIWCISKLLERAIDVFAAERGHQQSSELTKTILMPLSKCDAFPLPNNTWLAIQDAADEDADSSLKEMWRLLRAFADQSSSSSLDWVALEQLDDRLAAAGSSGTTDADNERRLRYRQGLLIQMSKVFEGSPSSEGHRAARNSLDIMLLTNKQPQPTTIINTAPNAAAGSNAIVAADVPAHHSSILASPTSGALVSSYISGSILCVAILVLGIRVVMLMHPSLSTSSASSPIVARLSSSSDPVPIVIADDEHEQSAVTNSSSASIFIVVAVLVLTIVIVLMILSYRRSSSKSRDRRRRQRSTPPSSAAALDNTNGGGHISLNGILSTDHGHDKFNNFLKDQGRAGDMAFYQCVTSFVKKIRVLLESLEAHEAEWDDGSAVDCVIKSHNDAMFVDMQSIYERHLAPGCEYPVNMSWPVRNQVNQVLNDNTCIATAASLKYMADILERSSNDVFKVMEDEMMRRFSNTHFNHELVQLTLPQFGEIIKTTTADDDQ